MVWEFSTKKQIHHRHHYYSALSWARQECLCHIQIFCLLAGFHTYWYLSHCVLTLEISDLNIFRIEFFWTSLWFLLLYYILLNPLFFFIYSQNFISFYIYFFFKLYFYPILPVYFYAGSSLFSCFKIDGSLNSIAPQMLMIKPSMRKKVRM